MTSPTIASRTDAAIKPLAIYWTIGLIIGTTYLNAGFRQLPSEFSTSHWISIWIGLAITVVTTLAYAKVSTRDGRSLHLPTLIAFPLLNGLFETALFLASFKLGMSAVAIWTTNPVWLFLAGIFTFCAYSGAIHALFWLRVLPPHLNKDKALNNFRRVWMVGLVAVSVLWGWIYFAYQDVWSVVALHALFDAGMVYCIHYQLSAKPIS
ncbi:MAG: hypothetical protein AAFQ74_00865 [Cyanobacteria bacterium J06623_4]